MELWSCGAVLLVDRPAPLLPPPPPPLGSSGLSSPRPAVVAADGCGGGRFQLLQFLPSLVVRRDEPAAPLADAAQRQIRSIPLPLLRRERLLYRRGRRCSFLSRRCSCSRGRRRTDNPDPWRLPSEVPPPCAAASSHFLRRKFFLKRLKQGPGPGQSRALSPQPNGPGQPREAAPRKSRKPRNGR